MMRIEIQWRRKSYCAKLNGSHERYRVDREFQQGTAVKSRGALVFDLEPGWYEVQEGPGNRSWYAIDVDGLEPRRLSDAFDLVSHEASAGPLPGEPGCWGGDACHCGEPVASFDELGFPECGDHEGYRGVRPTQEPDLVPF